MHTLNEQVRKITHGNFADVAAQMIAAVVAFTGWEYDDTEYELYPDPANHTTKITLAKYTSSSERVKVAGYFNGTKLTEDYYSTDSTDVYVRVHKSSQETVTYVSFGDDEAEWRFVWAENINDEHVLYQGGSSLAYVGCNRGKFENHIPAYRNKGTRYSVAQLGDAFSERGGLFKELYDVQQCPSTNLYNNQLVNFDGKIMRIISLSSSASPNFAIPVSD